MAFRTPKFYALLAFILISIACGRIISTYTVFSRNSDEGAHIATGMEWLDRGTYLYEYQHPPFARIATALGPYLDGSRTTGQPDMVTEGDAIIYAKGIPSRTLPLARLGILPFFVLATFWVWWWTKRIFDSRTALAATLLFTTLQPILAHAGFAATDMPFTALFLMTLFTLTRWLERPTISRSVGLGVSLGLTILAKFSTFLFFPVCAVAMLLWYAIFGNSLFQRYTLTRIPSFIGKVFLIGIITFLVTWAGYRFHIRTLAETARYSPVRIEEELGAESLLYKVYRKIEHYPLPLTEMAYGILRVKQHNREGHDSYLLGENRKDGWWYFFPVALAVKTPIAFLLLSGIGVVAVIRLMLRVRDWELGIPLILALVLLLTVLPSRINIGLRHILAIYPFLSMLAGRGVVSLFTWKSRKVRGLTIGILLLAWQLASGVVIHPDYLAYFNEFVGRHPERFLINSDLDWGQDMYRLRNTLQESDIREISVAVRYHPSRDLYAVNPDMMVRSLRPGRPANGWIAISAGTLYRTPGYEWLQAQTPRMKVGKSIYLYDLP